MYFNDATPSFIDDAMDWTPTDSQTKSLNWVSATNSFNVDNRARFYQKYYYAEKTKRKTVMPKKFSIKKRKTWMSSLVAKAKNGKVNFSHNLYQQTFRTIPELCEVIQKRSNQSSAIKDYFTGLPHKCAREGNVNMARLAGPNKAILHLSSPFAGLIWTPRTF